MANTHPTVPSRTVTRTRHVEHTVGGRTRVVPEQYQAPKAPRDWDQIILNGVTTVAVGGGIGCVAWSTTSIGSLLSQAAPDLVAYGGAGVFDTLWISCTALGWLARYEPAKARAAHAAGWLCLGIAITALIVEGYTAGHLAAGIVGAFISIGVKLLWSLVIARHARTLDPLTQQWVEQELDEASGQLALATVNRRLARERAQVAAYYQALQVPQDDHEPNPDKPRGQRTPADATVRSAVRAALEVDPEATPDVIVERLARVGINTDPDTVRALSGQTDSRSATLHDLDARRGTDNITDTVRHLVRQGVTDEETLLALVRYVHADAKDDTVKRIARRVG
ncbi:protein transporter Sec31 [Kitasatospora sp. NPDC018058]|uniref:protein transporter Sec31 n=1 Tax=Kitasatospora sp. NPDC018058 TaxID=3364025 RepID=UPI0037C10141